MSRDAIEDNLRRFIVTEVISDRALHVTLETPLVASGSVDSMGLLQIFGFVQQSYGVDLAATGARADFATVKTLAAAIERLRGERAR